MTSWNGIKRNWKRIAGFSAAGLLLLLLLLPTIFVRSGLLASLVNRYSGINGTIEFESASLGWFSEIKFSNVTIADSADAPLATIGELKIARSLLGLLSSGIQGVEVAIKDSHFQVCESQQQLNWVELMDAERSSESNDPLNLTVTVEDSEFEFCDENGLQGSLAHVSGTVQLRPAEKSSGQEYVIQLVADSLSKASSGPLDLHLSLEALPTGELRFIETIVTATNAPIHFLNPVMALAGLPSFDAAIDGKSEIKYSNSQDTFTFNSRFDKFRLLATHSSQKSLVHGLPVIPVEIDGDLHFNSETESQVLIKTTYGLANYKGVLPSFTGVHTDELLNSTFRLEGEFDAAKFATDFPEWTNVRDDVEIRQGSLGFTAFNRPEGDRQRILVDLRVDKLVAQSGATELHWKKPVQFSCAVSRPAQGPSNSVELEFIECESDFLSIKGQGGFDGQASTGQITTHGNLAVLHKHLADFLDLGDFRLAGDVTGNIGWKTSSTSTNGAEVQLTGNSSIKGFSFGFSQDQGWNENVLSLQWAADVSLNESQLKSLEKLETTMTVDTDSATFTLRKPVEFSDDYQSVFDAKLYGSAKNWMKRLNSLFDSGIELDGISELTAVVSINPKSVRFRSRQFRLNPFLLRVADLQLDDSAAKADIDIVISKRSGTLKTNRIRIESPNVVVETDDLKSEVVEGQRLTEGDLRIAANAPRLSRWFFPSNLVARGVVEGTFNFTNDSKGFRWTTNLQSEKLDLRQKMPGPAANPKSWTVLVPPAPTKLTGSGLWSDNQLHLKESSVTADLAEISLSGRLDFSTSPLRVDLEADLQTEIQSLIAYFAPELVNNIRLSGGRPTRLSLNGPLTSLNPNEIIPGDLTGTAEIARDSGELFALPLKKGNLKVSLAQSALSTQPGKIDIAEGKLSTASILDLGETPSIQIPTGPLLENANIGPNVFKTWMRFVTPIFADATEARGRFSVVMDGPGKIPLQNPIAGNLKCKMLIDSMAVGPGPSGQSLIGIVHQVLSVIGKENKLRSFAGKSWLELPTQQVKITLSQGTVSHEILKFQMGEVVVYTSGSVNARQEIDMIVHIPIEADWFKEQPLLKSVVGNGIQIPIKGKVNAPKFELELLKSLSKRLATGAVGNLLEEKSGGLLNKDLFQGDLLKGIKDKRGLGKFFEGQAEDLLKKGLLKGLEKIKEKEK